MFCPNCGMEVRKTDNYCYSCGHKLDFEAPTRNSPKTYKFKDKREDIHEGVRGIKVKLFCSIQGMDKNFRPNGSYKSYNLGKVTIEEALRYIRRLPRRSDFPAKILKGLREGEDVCPPAIIFSNDYTLNVATSDGETIEIVSFDFKELAGYTFENKGFTVDMVEVSREDAEKIVIDFFRKVDKFKKLRLGLTPLEYAVLFAISKGVSNSKAMSSITGASLSDVKDAIRRLREKGWITVKKKGLIRKKYWYELTDDGEKKLHNSRRRIEKAVRDDRDAADILAIPLFMMFAMNDAPDGIDASEVSDVLGDLESDTFVAEISEAEFKEIAYDTDVDVDADSAAGDDGGDWGDDGADDGW